MERKQLRVYVKGLALLLILLALGYVIRLTGLEKLLNEGWIDSHIRGQGIYGWGLFLLVVGATTALGLPRQIAGFLGGYAYGFIGGTLASVAGSLLGSCFSFYCARIIGRKFMAKRFAGKVGKIDNFLRANPFSMILMLRFFPVGSNVATNTLSGVSSIGSLPFFAATILGYIPQNATFALLGSGFKVDFAWRVTLSIILFAISTWLGFVLYQRQRALAKIVSED